MNRMTIKIHLMMACLFASLVSLGATNILVPGNFPTISAAMAKAKKGDSVTVEDGTYRGHIYVNPGVALIASNLFKSVIDGNGKGTVVTMSNGATITGFQIRNGTIGVFNTSAGVSILRCLILNHQQTGIMCVGHLPRIEDNLIVYNKGSGIQGWDVWSTSSTINHNTISMNSNHGISIGGNSSIIVENNIISNNEQFGVKSSDDKVRVTMVSNNFFQNAKFTELLPVDNYSIDPMFKNAQQYSFSLNSESRCIGKGSDNQDIGARLVY